MPCPSRQAGQPPPPHTHTSCACSSRSSPDVRHENRVSSSSATYWSVLVALHVERRGRAPIAVPSLPPLSCRMQQYFNWRCCPAAMDACWLHTHVMTVPRTMSLLAPPSSACS
eukprot:366260-Chlamydomonas_euryale.AAC.25